MFGTLARYADRYLQWHKSRQNSGTLKNPDLLFARSIIGALAKAGVTVNESAAMGVPTVFACVRQIAQSMATVPVNLHEIHDDGSSVPVTLDSDRALADVVRTRPNEEMTSLDYFLSATSGLALYQNSVTQIRRNGLQGVVELVPIHPDKVDIQRDFETSQRTLMGRNPLRYRVEGLPTPLLRRDVVHLKGISFDGLSGIPMTQVARESIGLAIALDRNASSFFGNSSRPGLVFECPDELDDESYARLSRELTDAHVGVEKAYKAMLLEAGTKASKITSENRESQFDESRERQGLDITRFFGVPPHKVGILNSEPKANIEEQNIEFVLTTVAFYCEVWRQGLNHSLLTPEQRSRGLSFVFDLRPLLAGNLKDKAQAWRFGGDLSTVTIDEFRRNVYGLNPLPNGEGKTLVIPPNVKREEDKEPSEEQV